MQTKLGSTAPGRAASVLLSAGLLSFSVMTASPTAATTILYDEPPDLTSPLSAFTLNIGPNSITGSSAFTVVSGGLVDSFDADPFKIIVPVGLSLASVEFHVVGDASLFVDGNAYDNYELWTDSGSPSLLATASFDLASAASNSPFGSALPLGAGTFRVINTDPTVDCDSSFCDGTWNYAWTFTVQKDSSGSSVPEPATLALFALGLVGLGVSRRKH